MSDGIVLGDNQYGKAESHVVRVFKRGSTHDIKDMNVSVALTGDFADAHLTGDNSKVVPTDTQKNTVFAFAADDIGEIEDFGLRLARHFVKEFATVHRTKVSIEEFAWSRIGERAFERSGEARRLTTVTCTRDGATVVSGVTGLVILKTTDSEFHGYIKDRYTTLQETRDRIMATALAAHWRYRDTNVEWARCYDVAMQQLKQTFAAHHSLSLQQTLYEMGKAVLEACEEIVEIRLSMPNKHHFVVDLEPFQLENPNEVFYAADRPYGLIEGTVKRDGVPDAPEAW
jgi:urate oxidase